MINVPGYCGMPVSQTVFIAGYTCPVIHVKKRALNKGSFLCACRA